MPKRSLPYGHKRKTIAWIRARRTPPSPEVVAKKAGIAQVTAYMWLREAFGGALHYTQNFKGGS